VNIHKIFPNIQKSQKVNKMPYIIKHIKNKNIICIRGVGHLKKEDYIKGFIELIDILKKHNSQ
jgi:hypothetical protein